jgi:hypothetical protein
MIEIIQADARSLPKGKDGRFVRGHHYNPATEFRKGQHWRSRKPWWQREWLVAEYVDQKKSAARIASEQGCDENNVLYWLKKHRIKTRTMREVRSIKHWGAVGPANPLFGKRGPLSSNWKGGLTPLRQAVYASWAWRKAKRRVHERDVCCRICKSSERLEIHHITPFHKAPERATDASNLILLCMKCHKKIEPKWKEWKIKLLNLIVGEESDWCRHDRDYPGRCA